ncbi:MAG: efflux RND transporter periplasmic adaptor subunit [Chthoniobacterales bacterium]|nr:efflux RND transporter periplasmic adaptor subunit [Chthoniobacterales bacterium]
MKQDTSSHRHPHRLRAVLVAATLLMLVVVGWLFAPRILQSDSKPEASSATKSDGKTQYWISGMHPWIIMPEPGQCPICGMDLVPLDPAKFAGEIAINPIVVQNMGVRVADVVEGPLIKTTRTVGIVAYDEENVRDVNTKVSGWIEKIHVDSLGAPVREGEPLFSVYSPQLYSAQEDYLVARRGGDRTLLEAARKRLEYLDVTNAQIEALAKNGATKTLQILSPFNGVVTEKHANEGMKVDPGMRVYRIADLSRVWVIATVYEYQLPFIEEGQEAEMSLPYIPGQTFRGRVSYIYPYLDTKTREAQVRLEFDNPQRLLKPGMFANVELEGRLAATATLVPRSAVIDTGRRQVAFVSLDEGKFEPRTVETGVSSGDGMIQILSGLTPGEKVVTSGQFLLDSEANMREALAKMLKGESAAEQSAQIETSTSQTIALSKPAAGALRKALDAYLTIQDRLAQDSLEGVAAAAASFSQDINALSSTQIPDNPHFWHERNEELKLIETEANRVQQAGDLAEARLAFGRLSVPFRDLVLATGAPSEPNKPLLALRCPMFLKDQGGAVWLQTGEDVRNPYMGQRMLECFDEREIVPAATIASSQP